MVQKVVENYSKEWREELKLLTRLFKERLNREYGTVRLNDEKAEAVRMVLAVILVWLGPIVTVCGSMRG